MDIFRTEASSTWPFSILAVLARVYLTDQKYAFRLEICLGIWLYIPKSGDGLPIASGIVLFAVGHWVVGIRPQLFLFSSCTEDNSSADQALGSSSAPSCTTERPWAFAPVLGTTSIH